MNEKAKKVSLRERIQIIQKELKEVKKTLNKLPSNAKFSTYEKINISNGQIGYPSKNKEKVNVTDQPMSSSNQTKKGGIVSPATELTKRHLFRDERFVDYLATSIEPVRPLRYQRRYQRNKAFLLLIIIVFILLWLIGSRLY